MNQKYRNLIMWALYAALFLAAVLAQTTVFGRVRFYDVKLSILPITMVCIGMQTDHEAAGLFGLLAGLCWFAFGAEDGTLSIVTLPAAGILAGWLCDNLFSRRLLPALLLSLGALALHEGALFVIRFYLGSVPGALAQWVPKTVIMSLAVTPVIFLLSRLIRKAGVSN